MGLVSNSGVTASASSVGVLGGTFDPVHSGHLAIAEAVRNKLGLDVVLFVVAADQWLRSVPPVASAAARLAMVERAVEDSAGLEASDVDIVRGGSTYTADTLVDLRERLVGATELHLIVGADSAMSMDRWKRADEIGSLARVVMVGRPGLEFDGRLAKSHPAEGAVYVEGPMVDVSATAIRDRVQAEKSITGLVPDSVADYIAANELYR